MKKKRIAFVLTDMHIGGIPKASIPLMKNLKKYYEVKVILTHGAGDLFHLIPNGIDTIIMNNNYSFKQQLLKAVKKGRFLASIKSLYSFFVSKNWIEATRSIIKLESPIGEHFDCAIAYFGTNTKSLLITLDNIVADKKIAWIHGEHPFKKDEFRTIENIYSEFDRIYCVSKATEKSFLSSFPNCKGLTNVLYALIDVESIIKLSKVPCILPFDKNKINILTVGRISPEKGQEMIPYICLKLKEYKINFKWILVGDGPLMQELKSEALKLQVDDVLVFEGFQENPYPYIAGCNIFVQPSFSEGYSIVTREAAIFSKPIVATNVGGQAESFINCVDAFLVQPNVDDLTKAIITYLDNSCLARTIFNNLRNKDYSNISEFYKLLKYIG